MAAQKTIVFGKPFIDRPEIAGVISVLNSGWIGTGPQAQQFEKMFARYKGAKYAIALNSCTSALNCALVALGIKKGDEVIVPTMSYVSAAHAVVHSGAQPVFVDCQKSTMNLTAQEVSKKITFRTKAIIPVHFAGRPCEMYSLMRVARKHNVHIIEDCAHAIEAKYHKKKTGTFGKVGVFSFYANKNLTTGEGGMAITDSLQLEKKIRLLALDGMTSSAWGRFQARTFRHSVAVAPGYKYNLPDLLAAIGIQQLKRIEQGLLKRKQIWNSYNQAFKDLPVFTPPPCGKDTRHACHLYTLLLDIERLNITRDEFLNAMLKHSIGVGVHYLPLHLHPFYQKTFFLKAQDFPNANWVFLRTVSLPLYPHLKDSEVERIIQTVTSILKAKWKRRFMKN